jgi:ferredoxin
MSLGKFFIKNMLKPNLEKIYAMETELNQRPDLIKPLENAPTRFNHPERAVNLVLEDKLDLGSIVTPRLAPIFIGSMLGVLKANKSIEKNPSNPRTEITDAELEELKELAESLNCEIGFAKLDHRYIFRDKAISFDNSIVLAMEMEKEALLSAPSEESNFEVQLIYRELGNAGNKIADWLRAKGFACHSVPPRNGLTLHPPMAVKGGIGGFGYHGLCITEAFGPRVRVGAVHTNITNLPFYAGHKHDWIMDFCMSCKLCAKHCPGDAFFDEPVQRENGLVTHIDQEKCFPFFAENHGCAVCIAVCPFSKEKYSVIKESMER